MKIMWDISKIKKIFTFDKIVGYATIAGSLATIAGATIVNKLKVELNPIIKVMQEEQQGVKTKIVRDTITLIRKDTVIRIEKEIIRDTVILYRRDYSHNPKEREREKLDDDERNFRHRHNLP